MQLEEFCKLYNLGTVRSCVKLSGGLMHKMFKVETDKGVYAVKVLNPEVMRREEAYDNFVISETISNLAKDNGIIVSSALLLDGNYLNKIGEFYYMVFDYVDGKVLSDEEINAEHCKKIGRILAKIHSLSYEQLGLEEKKVNYSKLYDWESYVSNPNFSKMSYRDEYLRNYGKYNSLLKRANERFNNSNTAVSLCHNDMDIKNVMWNNDEPIVIDWESASLSNPYRELVEDALCWSGFLSNNFDKDKFRAVIEEYIKVRPIEHHRYDTICGNLVGRFEWLKYNLDRSLGICSDDIEEMKLAENEVVKTMVEINRYVELIGTMYEIICDLTKEADHDYDDVIEGIVNSNDLLKGKKIEFIAVGFTNKIYKVGDYIVRICIDHNNEDRFLNEIKFYQANEGNSYLPNMYYFDTTKEVVPYYYQVIERVEGKTLYEVWYKLSSDEKRKIVSKIVDILKSFHLHEVNGYDYKSDLRKEIISYGEKCNLDQELVSELLSMIDVYFNVNKFGLIHNDLHFDNFIYDGERLTLIDFERSKIAPIDYDFKIFARCASEPWLWAGAGTDMLAVEVDYQDLIDMFLESYDELREIPYVRERLEIYNILDVLDRYYKLKNGEYLEEAIDRIKKLKANNVEGKKTL